MGYPSWQLSQALVAATGADAAARERAAQRVRRWQSVLDGMASGTLDIGSRSPVVGLPVWATPDVVRGGFATGEAAAGGRIQPYELRLAKRLGLPVRPAAPVRREELFAWCLTDAGLAELHAMLDSGQYRVGVPEEAALLVVSWLLRAGDRSAALRLLEVIGPYAERLRFTPEPVPAASLDPSLVWRSTVGQARAALAAKQTNARIAAMNEALAVWNPFADDLLELWLSTVEDGRVLSRLPEGWPVRAATALARYRALAAAHTFCTKHRNRRSNLAIMRGALEEFVARGAIGARTHGLLQHVVDAMVARRGAPGSNQHTVLRSAQRAHAARPTHASLARELAERLATLPQDQGFRSTVDDVTAGLAVPSSLRRVVARASAGTVEELVAAGLVPSAEVLAGLIPRLAASAVANAYVDPALRTLVAEHYRAFRTRRSLLLVNLAQQVRIDELPWVEVLHTHRAGGEQARTGARDALAGVATLALHSFPGTVLPNPLVRELTTLSHEAGLDLPWVEELAADIFMGTFSAKFLAAAKLAASTLDGTVYQRYYGIDGAAVLAIEDADHRRHRVRTSRAFDELCRVRAGNPAGSVAANGMVIEQAQILTTHNLALLAGQVGVRPADGWGELTRAGLRVTVRLVAKLHGNPRPLSTVKDAAYAWRQTLCFLSLADEADRAGFPAWAATVLEQTPAHVQARLRPVLDGLGHVLAGGTFDDAGAGGNGRRLLGWTVGRHWMLEV